MYIFNFPFSKLEVHVLENVYKIITDSKEVPEILKILDTALSSSIIS